MYMNKQARHEMNLKLAELLGHRINIVGGGGFEPRILADGKEWNPVNWMGQAMPLACLYDLVIHPSSQTIDVWPAGHPEKMTRVYRRLGNLIGYARDVEPMESTAKAICIALMALLEEQQKEIKASA